MQAGKSNVGWLENLSVEEVMPPKVLRMWCTSFRSLEGLLVEIIHLETFDVRSYKVRNWN